MMPYKSYASMSDEDVESLVAYLNTLPPMKNPLVPTQIRFPVNLMIKSVRGRSAVCRRRIAPIVEIRRVSGRNSRLQRLPHTGRERAARSRQGNWRVGKYSQTTQGTVVSANITPDLDTGIGKWTEDHFLKKFYDYKEYAAAARRQRPVPTRLP